MKIECWAMCQMMIIHVLCVVRSRSNINICFSMFIEPEMFVAAQNVD